MTRSTFDPITKKAALFSGLLHLFALLFLVLAVIFSDLFAREEEPHIFEMVALPVSDQLIEELSLEPIQEVTIDIPEPEPIDLPPPPEPQPEPVQETPPPPEPKPQPVVERTPPPPVPVEKPKPEPKPEPPKPKIITRSQFEQEHGKIEKPKPRAPEPPKPQTRKIDTSKVINQINKIASSFPDIVIDAPTAVADTDAMKQWRGMLATRLAALWKQIETKGTAGRSVRVSFLVSAGGSISSVKVINSSGISQLDNLGIETVRRLGNVMAPPSGKAETVTVRLKVE